MAPVLHTFEQLMGELKEVQFTLAVGGEDVPGLLFLRRDLEEPAPLVLIQHPGLSSKDDYFVRDVAARWAGHGWICGGVDAPLHGDRKGHDPMAVLRDPARFAEMSARFTVELRAIVDAIAGQFPADLARLGFVGYSMGSMLGIPAVAADGRFKAAAFCLVGEGGLVGKVDGPGSAVARLRGVAVRVVGKAQDELIPRAATEALYAALPGEKDIAWFPGGHFNIGEDVITAAGAWMRAKL